MARKQLLIDSQALGIGRLVSPFFAKVADGRRLEEAYQQAKGYKSWREGKGKPALTPDFDYEGTYQRLYEEFAESNPELMNQLAEEVLVNNAELIHPRARTTQNPANALTAIIQARAAAMPELTEEFVSAPGGHRPALFFQPLGKAPDTPTAQPAPQLPLPLEQPKIQPRMAHGPEFLQKFNNWMESLPEFVREDVVEGIMVGLGTAVPVALMPNQDPEEKAAAILGGMGAGIFGGAAAKHIGAGLGHVLHAAPLEAGSYGHNFGRLMGRREPARELMADMLGDGPPPTITGEHFGRGLGRAIGDEAFAIGGTIGGLAAAQATDATPDPLPQPTISQVSAATIPGALIGLGLSGLAGGLVDVVGLQRALDSGNVDATEALRQNSVFRRKPGSH